jgi:hypothetical protein
LNLRYCTYEQKVARLDRMMREAAASGNADLEDFEPSLMLWLDVRFQPKQWVDL